jgi:hypothetical protein
LTTGFITGLSFAYSNLTYLSGITTFISRTFVLCGTAACKSLVGFRNILLGLRITFMHVALIEQFNYLSSLVNLCSDGFVSTHMSEVAPPQIEVSSDIAPAT